MSESLANGGVPLRPSGRATSRSAALSGGASRVSLAAQYALSLVFVGIATLLAFVAQHLIAAPNLTLIYVLPVVVTATIFDWGPALAAALAGVLAFDFFFTRPFFSLRIDSPSDMWAAALLLVVAAIVSSLAAQSRRRAVESDRAARQAEALQELAHVVIEAGPPADIPKAAATALNRIFEAPAVVFVERGVDLQPVAAAGGGTITGAEEEAARGALTTQLPTRGGTYPYDQSRFDFWPVATAGSCRCVMGVDFTNAATGRPAAPERFVDVVGAYLGTAFEKPAQAAP
jgi:K+-sensing histidine kinase KdpD